MPIYALSIGKLLGGMDHKLGFVRQFVHHSANTDLTKRPQVLSDRPWGGSHGLGGGKG